MAVRLPRFFSLHLRSSSAGTEVQAKAMSVSEMGCVSQLRSPFSPLGKVRRKLTIRSRNSRQSARMAPTWMTIVYIFQYEIVQSGIFIRASAMRRCAVELTGKNSVKPSTIPNRTDKKYGFKRASIVLSIRVCTAIPDTHRGARKHAQSRSMP